MSGVQWVAERAVESCRTADACVAIADRTTSTHLRWAENAVTTSGSTEATSLTVIAMAGPAVGVVVQTGDLNAESVARLAQAAERAARAAPPDPVAHRIASGALPAPATRRAPRTSFESLVRLVPKLVHAFDLARSNRELLYGYAEHQVQTTHLVSSTGLHLCHVHPTGVLDMTAVAGDRQASAWDGVRVPDLVETDPAAMAAGLHRRLDWPARQVDPRTDRYEVLLPPSAVADLMLHLYRAANGPDAAAGRSVFGDGAGGTRIGERITATAPSLYSDPHEPGLACAPFAIARTSTPALSVFDNGVSLSRTDWVTDGVLTALTGSPVQGHTPRIDNLVMTGGTRTLDEMIAETRRGILPTSVWYLREVDPRTLLLTGITRDGVHLVVDGEVVGTVPGFRFNESPVSMLDRVLERGATTPTLPREWNGQVTHTAMPPLRVADFPVSGPSS